MTEQKKLPSNIEENIQNLAGDIYLQIEDKITALLSSYSDNFELTPEIITAHPLFTALKEQQQTQQQQADQNHKKYSTELTALQTEKENQQVELAQLHEDLINAKNLNSAQLSNSADDKLAESTSLAKQLESLSQDNLALAKNDKAKAATLAVQNQQYSDLQLKFDQVSSELQYLKAEQEHKLLSSEQQLNHEQNETQKQQINAKWIEEQEKTAQLLKQASDDNAQLLKQVHDGERNKQALENELANVNDELTAINQRQVQVLDSVKMLEIQVQQEQAAATKLSNENNRLQELLVQAEQGYSKDNKQQAQQVADLTKELAQVAIEAKNTQEIIAHLEQKNQQQDQQVTSLTQQGENEQLKFKQAIDKQDENHQQMAIGHQQALADKNAVLTELQQQADKVATELSEQLSTQTELLAAESTKLTAVQAELAISVKNRLWHQENKDKQELEYNKARATIKSLRDENVALNLELEQQVSELEDKLTEYRLRFEYAQKQLSKLSK